MSPINPIATNLVSVVIPTFNRRKWIEECLDSVLGQTYSNVEIIVVDDCSTDGTIEWLRSQKKYSDIVIIEQERNGGASEARNAAIRVAHGELIVFIDSDDLLMPNHLETAVSVFEDHPELGLFCCDSRMIDAEGNVILDGKTWHQSLADAKGYNIETGFRSLEDVFRHSNCFPGFTVHREVFDELGGFDQSIFPADDYDLALRIAASRFTAFYYHEPLCLRREHDGQCSGIENSVRTQIKLIEALERAAPKITDSGFVRRRFSEIRMELGLSEIKGGMKGAGIRTIWMSLLSNPGQVRTLAKIVRRKLASK